MFPERAESSPLWVRECAGETRRGSELERLYREHGQRLWRAVLAFAGDPAVASDAVGEAFSQALYRGSAIRSPSPWIGERHSESR